MFSCPCFLGLRLSSKGYKFVSQTDTELLAHLVQDMKVVRWPNLRDCLLQDLKKQMEGATYTEVQLVGFDGIRTLHLCRFSRCLTVSVPLHV